MRINSALNFRFLAVWLVLAAVVTPVFLGFARAGELKPLMLPPGYLSTRGSQIVDSHGRPVRIACIGGLGTVVDGGPLGYDNAIYRGLDSNVAAMRAIGFNCIRADFNDKCVIDPAMMAQFDQLVAACKKYGLKVIFDHHNDEATPADWGNAAQQTNGLWYDSGPGSYGTDGAGDKGTITNEKFVEDWVALAKHYAGNTTVIGFDLDNEPHVGYGQPDNGENWGQGGPGDIWAMYTTTGNAIEAVDPGVLIICEGFNDVTDKSSILWWTMDLSHAATKPVILKIPHKVVYSVHEYPNSPNIQDEGFIKRIKAAWGYLVEQNIAPVWIGEMGSSLDKLDWNTSIAVQQDWGKTLLNYMDGQQPGGIKLSKDEQPMSGDWWSWGCNPTYTPDGCLAADGSLKTVQAPYVDRLLFWPKGYDYKF